MYLWIGCKLPETFEQTLRRHCLEVNQTIGLSTHAFSLPQHISLKISFDAGARYEQILSWLDNRLSQESAFSVHLLPPERLENILWLPVAEHPRLTALHQTLDLELEQHFGIPQHPFDREFFFHSTLFMDEDRNKLMQMESALKNLSFPEPLRIDTFLIGISPDGKNDIQIAQKINIS